MLSRDVWVAGPSGGVGDVLDEWFERVVNPISDSVEAHPLVV